jgi:GTP pyrophosphokinase
MKSSKGALRHRLMQLIDELKAQDRVVINNAVNYAEEMHDGFFRKSTKQGGRPEPYIVHPLKVALVVLDELGLKDPDALSVALLHDVLEHTFQPITAADLEERFGRSVALGVSVLTRPKPDPNMPRDDQLATFYDRIRRAHVLTRLICLADRLDNMRDSLDLFDEEFQRTYLEETLKVHLPLAEETDPYLFSELRTVCEQLTHSLSVA